MAAPLSLVEKADEMAGVLDALPAEPGVHALEQRAEPRVRPRKEQATGRSIKQDLLVLGADAKGAGRLAPVFEPGGQRVARFDNFPVDDVASHKAWRPCGRRAGGWRLDRRRGGTMQMSDQRLSVRAYFGAHAFERMRSGRAEDTMGTELSLSGLGPLHQTGPRP